MDDGYTDADGFFQLSGHAREFTTIDPKVYIYHDCDDWLVSPILSDPCSSPACTTHLFQPCQRRFGIAVPKKYVTDGSVPKIYYDVGTIELAGKFSGETRDCIH